MILLILLMTIFSIAPLSVIQGAAPSAAPQVVGQGEAVEVVSGDAPVTEITDIELEEPAAPVLDVAQTSETVGSDVVVPEESVPAVEQAVPVPAAGEITTEVVETPASSVSRAEQLVQEQAVAAAPQVTAEAPTGTSEVSGAEEQAAEEKRLSKESIDTTALAVGLGAGGAGLALAGAAGAAALAYKELKGKKEGKKDGKTETKGKKGVFGKIRSFVQRGKEQGVKVEGVSGKVAPPATQSTTAPSVPPRPKLTGATAKITTPTVAPTKIFEAKKPSVGDKLPAPKMPIGAPKPSALAVLGQKIKKQTVAAQKKVKETAATARVKLEKGVKTLQEKGKSAQSMIGSKFQSIPGRKLMGGK